MTKIVVQFTGGVESTYLYALAIKRYGVDNVFPIAFDDSSLSWKFTEYPGILTVLRAFGAVKRLFVCKFLQADQFECPTNTIYAGTGFIPGYMLLLNATALSYAQSIGASEVWVGYMRDNVHSDETAEFHAKLSQLYNDTYTVADCDSPRRLHLSVQLKAPLLTLNKAETLIKAQQLLQDILWLTVSCGEFRGSVGMNCGVCDWCTKRRAGFASAGIEDKTPYSE